MRGLRQLCLPRLGDETREELVVDEKDTERQDQIVQKGVVGAEDYADLPNGDDEEANDTNATGKEKHPDEN